MTVASGKTTFTLAEAADLLSCHKETLRRAIRNGELRAAKLGREFRMSRPDLEAFWASCGGGDLFDRSQDSTVHGDDNAGAAGEKSSGKGRKPKKDKQEQFALLNSLDLDKEKS